MNDTDSTRPWEGITPIGPMLRPKEVIAYLSISRAQLYEMIAQGAFPPFIKLSERASAMPKSWLDAFLKHRAEKLQHTKS